MRVLVPLVVALALAGSATALLPFACETCDIIAHDNGYEPAVVEVVSGGEVLWETIDYTHIQVESGLRESCFTHFAQPEDPEIPPDPYAAPIRFAFEAGRVTATQNGETLVCQNAIVLPAGGAILPYHCAIHPTMRGALVVTTL